MVKYKYTENKAENVKIAYIGGGSKGWAWTLMSDLAVEKALSGEVYLYDIDKDAAKQNEIIGNKIKEYKEGADNFTYKAVDTYKEALTDADFVIISILPGTFDEMESDVHTPEKYGIYQSVGDTVGVGGIVRALRTLPMFEEFALEIKKYCPNAWVINYTNPMTMCVKALYKAFPEIKAFGCCHEVFEVQKILARVMKIHLGLDEDIERTEIKTNVVGINHFTWFTEAKYKNIDIFPIYKKFCEEHKDTGFLMENKAEHWMNGGFYTNEKVKMDLFLRYGSIAAVGDRHLAEFCPNNWYLGSHENAASWGFGLTSVDWRRGHIAKRLERKARLVSGEEKFEFKPSGEEGVRMIKALLGLDEFVTNVNVPNYGQIPNLPLGSVVETNARFCADTVSPVMAGDVPQGVHGLMSTIVENQDMVVDAAAARDLELAFKAFCKDPQNNLSLADSRKLFKEMIENTKKYLDGYEIENF